jgi:hypothetical protein
VLLSHDATTDEHGAIGSGAAKSDMAWSIGTPRMLIRMRQFDFGCTELLVIQRNNFRVLLTYTDVAFSPSEVSLDGAFTAWPTPTAGRARSSDVTPRTAMQEGSMMGRDRNDPSACASAEAQRRRHGRSLDLRRAIGRFVIAGDLEILECLRQELRTAVRRQADRELWYRCTRRSTNENAGRWRSRGQGRGEC